MSYFCFIFCLFIVYFIQETFIIHMMPCFFPFFSKSLFGLFFFVYVFFFLYLCHFYGAYGHNRCFVSKDYIGTPQAGSFHSFPYLPHHNYMPLPGIPQQVSMNANNKFKAYMQQNIYHINKEEGNVYNKQPLPYLYLIFYLTVITLINKEQFC